MRGVYGRVTPAMREDLKTALQQRWQDSLRQRALIAPRSIVPALDALLANRRDPLDKIRSHSAPENGHMRTSRLAARRTNER